MTLWPRSLLWRTTLLIAILLIATQLGSLALVADHPRFRDVKFGIIMDVEASRAIRSLLAGRRIYSLNLISSPGSGKTTLINVLSCLDAPTEGTLVVAGQAKGAVVAMTRQLAVDYPTQIRVNCVCPGTVDSPFVEGYLEKYHKHEKEKVRAELNARQPIGRLGKPEEIANLALYLASDEAGFVNGSVVSIDGGWTAA